MLTGMPCGTKAEIEKAAATLLDKGVKAVCCTLGAEGCYYADSKGEAFFEKLSPVELMSNATGAGDAFTAGLAHAYLKGEAAHDMVRFALACGKLAVKAETTINPDMSEKNVYKELK